ncbi:5'/3'-nucleotidase SurE [Vibrio fluvialis]|uniref:5'/3'-nucleotidase SurE n=1 Tax=Vibrio fluvialis TaxID=676 RepID=UPI001ABEC7A6|nr:5'/3'-nucleotidase SurE [Vibrio fluvialis]QTH07415.1 5'/3'-nucleotidase SurE [Vibrio fluvialis]
MKQFSKVCLTMAACGALTLSNPSFALNILLTNDDSWDTTNIQVMKSTLEAAGHDVIMSAPCTGQSGKGGAMTFLKPVSVDETQSADQEYCVGDTDTSVAFSSFAEGTPVMAAIYGIDVAAQAVWGQDPDLVISGPNEGNNLGYMNNNSGTLGAAMISLSRGIPAIAVSANSNTPEEMNNTLGYKFTDVGWNGGGALLKFSDDLSTDSTALYYTMQSLIAGGMTSEEAQAAATSALSGKQGLTFTTGDAGDSSEDSEGVAVNEGYITVSTIDGNVQAARGKVALVGQRLIGLE